MDEPANIKNSTANTTHAIPISTCAICLGFLIFIPLFFSHTVLFHFILFWLLFPVYCELPFLTFHQLSPFRSASIFYSISNQEKYYIL